MKRPNIKFSNFFSKNTKSYTIALSCIIMLLQASCSDTDDGNHNVEVANFNSVVNGSDQGTFNEVNHTFIDSAMVSGIAEVTLGRLASNAAFNNSVRVFGQQMVNDHTSINDQLIVIAQRKNLKLSSQPDPAHSALIIRLTTYTGYQFDTAYLNNQVIDHRKAINLFQNAANYNGGDQFFRGFASINLPTLNRHLYVADSLLNNLKTNGTSGRE